MRLVTARCDSCGNRFLLAHLRRMVWARLCVECAKRATNTQARAGVRAPLGAAGEAGGAESQGLHGGWSEGFRSAALASVPFAVIGLLAAFSAGGLGSFAGGVLWALTLTWFVFALLRAPFSGPEFALECALQALILWVAGRGELPGTAAVDLPLAAGFFVTLVARTLWFGVHLAGLAHEDGEFLEGAKPPPLTGGRVHQVHGS